MPNTKTNNEIIKSPMNNSQGREDLKPITLPKPVIAVPLLVGKYSIENNLASISGRWGMSAAAFEQGGVTSPFQLTSNIGFPMAVINVDKIHPAVGEAVLIVDEQPNALHPVFRNRSVLKDGLHHGSFSGSFQIQGVKGKMQTVSERNVELYFAQKEDNSEIYTASGTGLNKFGKFHLHGTYDKASAEIRLTKVYEPKVTKPVGKRGRTPKTARPAAKKVTKREFKTPATTRHSVGGHVATPIIQPMDALDTPRNRSERKRSVPAHLREDMEGLVPSHMKKCYDTVKKLMANQFAGPFLCPVDPVALNIPEYVNLITNPMDLGTVKGNLENGVYQSPVEVAAHIRLTFSNAMVFNRPDNTIYIWATKLLELFEKKWKSVLKNYKYEPPQEVESSPSMITSRKAGRKQGRRKSQKQSELEAMKEQIQEMKAQIQMMHSTGATPTPKAKSYTDLTPEELNRAMTFEEKREMSLNINRLPQDKVGKLLQIISERVPLKAGQDPDDDIEIDMSILDTPTLRTLQCYIRESLATKRKRGPAKPKRTSAQIELARKMERGHPSKKLKSMSSMPNALPVSVGRTDGMSSDSSATSSDSESDSDSSDDGLNYRKSPVLGSLSASAFAATTPGADDGPSSAALPALTKDSVSSEPVKVENYGAWSKMSSSTTNDESKTATASNSSSLWSAARSQEQEKAQREQELAEQQNRLVMAREKENAKKMEELEAQKVNRELQLKQEQENALLESEKLISERRKAEREGRECQQVDLEEQGISMQSMEAVYGNQSSFLNESS